jgi:hypothetical protein
VFNPHRSIARLSPNKFVPRKGCRTRAPVFDYLFPNQLANTFKKHNPPLAKEIKLYRRSAPMSSNKGGQMLAMFAWVSKNVLIPCLTSIPLFLL